MNTKDTKLIFEAYLTEREYGPAGSPSIDPNEWEVQSIYKQDEWGMSDSNPYNQYVSTALSDLDGAPGDSYILFFSLKQHAISHEEWTDPSVVIAVEMDRMEDIVSMWSEPIFVDKDGEGESHILSDDLARSLIDSNQESINSFASKDSDSTVYDPYGPEGVASRSDFDHR